MVDEVLQIVAANPVQFILVMAVLIGLVINSMINTAKERKK